MGEIKPLYAGWRSLVGKYLLGSIGLFCALIAGVAFSQEISGVVPSHGPIVPPRQIQPLVRKDIVVCQAREHYIGVLTKFAAEHFGEFEYRIRNGQDHSDLSRQQGADVTYIYLGGVPYSSEMRSCIRRFSKLEDLLDRRSTDIFDRTAPPLTGVPEDVHTGLISRAFYDKSVDGENFEALAVICYMPREGCLRFILSSVFSLDINEEILSSFE
jgi:hypothetical protein